MLQFIASLLFAQVQIISEPSATPTLAPAECRCNPGETCQCGDNCQCLSSKPAHAVNTPIISVVATTRTLENTAKPAISRIEIATARPPRIDPQSPITLAPVPDDINDHPDLIAFKEQYKNLGAPAAKAHASGPPVGVARPPVKIIPPVDKAAMVRVYVGTACVGGQCVAQYQWFPASQAPTKSVQAQPQRRRGLFGLRRR